VIRVSRNGFFIDTDSSFSQSDYQGVQLDPLVLPPTFTLIPAIGGTVTSDLGPAIPNVTVSLTQGGAAIGGDVSDANGTYYIPDLTAGNYIATVSDAFGKILVTKTIGVLGDQGTSLVNFLIAGINTEPVTITSSPSGQSFAIGTKTYTTPQTLQLFSGSTYAISFGAGIPQGAGTRYALIGWSDGSNANPRTITVGNAAVSYNANFGIQYLLVLAAMPPTAGAITTSPLSPDGYFAAGAQVQLTAAPQTGHRFISFSGAISGTTNPQTLVVSGPTSVAAGFTAPVSIISTHFEPGGVPVNTSTNVVLTVRISDITTVIPGSINLISTDSTGAPLQILGQLTPNSTQPDGSYGDYSIMIPVNQSSAQTLYFEVSVAARGSLRRIVSAPLALKIYNIPSDSEISQTVSAITGAANQFAQARASLGDTAALNQVAQSLRSQAIVQTVQFSPDNNSLLALFRDGTSGIITADRSPDSASNTQNKSIPTGSSLSEAGGPAEPHLATATAKATSAAAPSGPSVLVLAPQHQYWGPSKDPSDTINSDFSPAVNSGRLSSLTYLQDSNVTVASLKTLYQYNVVSLTSHGNSFQGVGNYILTGEPVTPQGDRNYDLDLRLGLLVRAYNPDAGAEFYAITPGFISYYSSGHAFPGSVVYLNASKSASDHTFADSLITLGGCAMFGHTAIATESFGRISGEQLFSVLSNFSLAPGDRTAAAAYAAVPNKQDGENSLAAFFCPTPVFVNSNSVVTVTKSGNGTGRVTSVPPGLDCGLICTMAGPVGNTTTLTATPDPGMDFNGWTGDCALPPNDPANPVATVDFSQDRSCTASFVIAASVSLSPFGFLDYSTTLPPYYVRLVAKDGITPVVVGQDVTVTLSKEVSSVCRTLPTTTLSLTIPAGMSGAALDPIAALDYCNNAFEPTATKWTIIGAAMGPYPLAPASGKTLLKVFRSTPASGL
jgi:hypothetical protein